MYSSHIDASKVMKKREENFLGSHSTSTGRGYSKICTDVYSPYSSANKKKRLISLSGATTKFSCQAWTYLRPVWLIGSRLVSAYFLSHNTIHSTSRTLFFISAEHLLVSALLCAANATVLLLPPVCFSAASWVFSFALKSSRVQNSSLRSLSNSGCLSTGPLSGFQ